MPEPRLYLLVQGSVERVRQGSLLVEVTVLYSSSSVACIRTYLCELIPTSVRRVWSNCAAKSATARYVCLHGGIIFCRLHQILVKNFAYSRTTIALPIHQPPDPTNSFRRLTKNNMQGPLVGVLALQGAFEEHQQCLERVGCRTIQVSGHSSLSLVSATVSGQLM